VSASRSWPRRAAIALALLLVVIGAAGGYLLGTYDPPAVDPAWAVEPSGDIPRGAVTVRWTGTATLVFSDGETTWMTDGWFSRPGPLAVLGGKIAPDVDAIERGLARNEVDELAVVFPVHSHYDHAMDAPEVAKRTGALLLGSESTANIGRGWGLPERQIRVVRDRERILVGRFLITPIASRHFEFPDPALRERALGDPDITSPLVPPAPVFAYKVGVAWVLHVAHPKGSFLVVGSAGFLDGALEDFAADTIFLGTGGLGSQTPDYREAYWRETVGRVIGEANPKTVDPVHPKRIIPIHWDSLTAPIEGPFRGPLRAEGFLSRGGDATLEFLKAKQAANPGLTFATLPRYAPVVLFR
jgi:L-ascorbate metabolism protein UlaG (beta-lactamase superfamily)